MTTATVAPGRCLVTPGGDASGYEGQILLGPGATIDLADDEFARLVALGFLVDTSKILVAIDGGPAYQIVDT